MPVSTMDFIMVSSLAKQDRVTVMVFVRIITNSNSRCQPFTSFLGLETDPASELRTPPSS